TAADISRFMIAHLQEGEFQGVRILRPETARLMHSRQFENLPGMNAMALGFYEETRNGHRIIGHGGDTQYFHSDLHLIPDVGVGFFISYNSSGKGEVNGQDRIAFKRDNSGNLLLAIDFPFMVFEKARWYQSSMLNLPLIVSSLAILLLTVLLWPIAALVRRHYGRRLTLPPRDRRLRLLVRIVCLLDMAFFAAFAGFFAMAFKDIGLLSPHYNPWLRMIQIVGWLGIL